MAYNFKEIEKKWQEKWDKEGTFNSKNDYTMKKWYGLIEFPYPSGQGLHVGHPRSYTALDVIARKRRLQGYNVLFPIDVWVRRVMNELYIKNEDETKVNKKALEKLAQEKFGNLAGIAQQYLFYWKREA